MVDTLCLVLLSSFILKQKQRGILAMKVKILLIGLCTLMLSFSAFAKKPAITIDGTIESVIDVPQKHKSTLSSAPSQKTEKRITFSRAKLTEQAKHSLQQRFQNLQSKPTLSASSSVTGESLPSKVELGMNGVPVLDQGPYPVAEVFANTAAIDAYLGKGDYVSQLCQLQLAQYLRQNSHIMAGGWDYGTDGPYVLNQIMDFGLVSKAQQQKQGCAGLKEYPNEYYYHPEAMTLPDYNALSEQLNERFIWEPIFDMETYFEPNAFFNASQGVQKAKQALALRQRVTIAFFVDVGVDSPAGAVGRYHVNNDTWSLSNEIIQDFSDYGAYVGVHAVTIIGYDDQALVTDPDGTQHRGVFTIRNSWGPKVGDHGNYYMTYDYFRLLAIEAQRIIDWQS